MKSKNLHKLVITCGVFVCLIIGIIGSANSVPVSPRAKVKMYHNSPTLFINNKPYFGWICMLPYPREKVIKSFADAGIHVYHTNTNLFTPPEETEKKIMQIVKSDPEAYIILNVTLHALNRKGRGKQWFIREHYGEQQYERLLNGKAIVCTQSIASKVWRKYATKLLERHITHLQQSPAGKHIIGYHLIQHEGNYIGAFSYERFPDYSKPMMEAFKQWIKKKYENDVEKLRKAWNQKNINFEDITVPLPKLRIAGEFSFRNPLYHQQVIDYDIFASELMSDYLIYFAKTVKEITKDKKIVGIYGGYVLGTVSCGIDWRKKGVTNSYQKGGSFACYKLADSPFIDYAAGPHIYLYRGPGEAVSPGGAPSGTWRFHKKLSVWEDDTRTFVMALFDVSGSCRTLEETIEVFKRNFGYNLTNGSLSWVPGTFFGYNACDNSDIMACLGKCQEIAKKSLPFERSPNAEVAVFVDGESYLYMKILSQVTAPLIDELLHNQLRKSGFPFDVYLLSDIKSRDFPDYKLYIFTNVFKIDNETEKAIKAKLNAAKSTALWFYAPGYATDSGFSAKRVSQIIGIKVNVEKKMGSIHVKVTDNKDQITKGMKSQIITFETDESKKSIGPLFCVNDPQATILGEVAENGKPGLAYKRIGNVTSIYSAAPGITWPFLRNIARLSGAHVYINTGDIIYASKDFLVIHAASSGEKVINLPTKNDVYDIYEESLVARGVKSFKINMKKGTTRLFFLGDVNLWKPGKKVTLSGMTLDELVRKNMYYKDVKEKKCFPISLKNHVNRLWFKDKTKNLPAEMPVGKQKLSNVPFDIINPKENNGKFCIILKGGRMPNFPQEVKGISVQKRVKNLYFLHTAGWMHADFSTTMEYIIHYADKSIVKIPIKAHDEITDGVSAGNFSFCGLGNPDAKVACIYKVSPRYKKCGFYCFRWKNPNPDKLIVSIDITTAMNTGEAVPAIIAITGETS